MVVNNVFISCTIAQKWESSRSSVNYGSYIKCETMASWNLLSMRKVDRAVKQIIIVMENLKM